MTRSIFWDTLCFLQFFFRTLFFVRGGGPWTCFQSFRFVIQIKRKLKRKRKRKRNRGNLRGGREAPPRRSLHPFRFWFRFRFNFRLIWITKRNAQYRKIKSHLRRTVITGGTFRTWSIKNTCAQGTLYSNILNKRGTLGAIISVVPQKILFRHRCCCCWSCCWSCCCFCCCTCFYHCFYSGLSNCSSRSSISSSSSSICVWMKS